MNGARANAARALPPAIAIAILALALLSLRWPMLVTLETLRGDGYVDRTIVAFVATFFMIVAGLPGLFIASFGGAIRRRKARLICAASLTSLLTGCLGSLVWIGASVRSIGATLTPLQIVVAGLSPFATAVVAVWLRVRIARDRADTDTWHRSLTSEGDQ